MFEPNSQDNYKPEGCSEYQVSAELQKTKIEFAYCANLIELVLKKFYDLDRKYQHHLGLLDKFKGQFYNHSLGKFETFTYDPELWKTEGKFAINDECPCCNKVFKAEQLVSKCICNHIHCQDCYSKWKNMKGINPSFYCMKCRNG